MFARTAFSTSTSKTARSCQDDRGSFAQSMVLVTVNCTSNLPSHTSSTKLVFSESRRLREFEWPRKFNPLCYIRETCYQSDKCRDIPISDYTDKWLWISPELGRTSVMKLVPFCSSVHAESSYRLGILIYYNCKKFKQVSYRSYSPLNIKTCRSNV